MDEELQKAIADYFEIEELALLLNISVVDFIRAFETEIEENEETVLTEMGYEYRIVEDDERD